MPIDPSDVDVEVEPPDRYEKAHQQREAALSRWESRSERVVRKTKEGIVDLVMRLVLLKWLRALLWWPLRAAGWLARQAAGTARNAASLAGYATFDRILPPGITNTIQYYLEAIPKALGLRDVSRNRQFTALTSLIILAALSTLLTGGLLIAVMVFLGLMLIATLWRLMPWFNKQWHGLSGQVAADDYDVPGWSRE